MISFYHAYEAYERQVIKGVFYRPSAKTRPVGRFSLERLMAGLGDWLIRLGVELRKPLEVKQTRSGSPALGKLNR